MNQVQMWLRNIKEEDMVESQDEVEIFLKNKTIGKLIIK